MPGEGVRLAKMTAGSVTHVALWGRDSDGKITECSFPGYARIPLGSAEFVFPADDEVHVQWPVVEFGPTPALIGVTPAGWALLDADGETFIEYQFGPARQFHPGTRWRIHPGLRLRATLAD